MSYIYLLGTERCMLNTVRLVDGRLTVELSVDGTPVMLTKNDYYKLAERIRHDLLSYNIPHTRIIGVNVVSNGVTDAQYISKLSGTDTSYAELLVSLSKLIYSAIDVQGEFQERNVLASISKSVTTEVGCIRLLSDKDKPLKALVNNLTFMNWVSKNESNTFVRFVALYSTGLVDFHQATEYIYGVKGGEYMPLRAVYDLIKIFTVHKFEELEQPEYVKLHYKCDIDESVLEDILFHYLSRIVFQEVNS